ncbi:MAG: hypothetical protein JXA35_00215 [Deltaproteobacteria bacterium]|nr:hypothetical protein [Deltaproteobacteria bacterium]
MKTLMYLKPIKRQYQEKNVELGVMDANGVSAYNKAWVSCKAETGATGL